jgi:wyosine [tRNA(Phe)-imidazoG37] synthetase (radical SAM superfamily)
MKYRYLFGPVASRRLGRSLGVDLLPLKTCPYDCVYCEVGRTTAKTTVRSEFVPAADVLGELEAYFASGGDADFVTVSGSGEPTLYRGLGALIAEVRGRFHRKVAVITNGALLTDAAVRRELGSADLVMPSLDSARQSSFEAVNRPYGGIRVDALIEGLVAFAREYRGRLWLEVLIVAGINDSDEDVNALSRAIRRIAPERIHLNTVVRLPAEHSARPVSRERLEAIAVRFGAEAPTEIIAPAIAGGRGTAAPTDTSILDTLKRRSCTAEDIAGGVGVSPEAVRAVLERLVSSGLARKSDFGGTTFYDALEASA